MAIAPNTREQRKLSTKIKQYVRLHSNRFKSAGAELDRRTEPDFCGKKWDERYHVQRLTDPAGFEPDGTLVLANYGAIPRSLIPFHNLQLCLSELIEHFFPEHQEFLIAPTSLEAHLIVLLAWLLTDSEADQCAFELTHFQKWPCCKENVFDFDESEEKGPAHPTEDRANFAALFFGNDEVRSKWYQLVEWAWEDIESSKPNEPNAKETEFREVPSQVSSAGAEKSPKQEQKVENKRAMIRDKLIGIMEEGEPYTSMDELSTRLKCAKGTISNAIHVSDRLVAWMEKKTKKPRYPSREPLDSAYLSERIEDPAPDPRDIALASLEFDEELESVIAQAKSNEERDKIRAMSKEEQVELIETCRSHQENAEPSPLSDEGKPQKVFHRV